MPRKSTQEDARIRHNLSGGNERASRTETADAERTHPVTGMSLEEQRSMIRNEFVQEALPNIPPVPGWHFCWLSVTSTYDPVHKRLRLGYVPVKPEELSSNIDLTNYRINSGAYEGCVACNEMVLFKIPEERYQAIMAEFHHEQPMEMEASIRERIEEAQVKDRSGKPLLGPDVEDQGIQSLGTRRRTPVFD